MRGQPGGLRDSYSCGCVTAIREYVLNTKVSCTGEVVRRDDAHNPRPQLVNGLTMVISAISKDPGPL